MRATTRIAGLLAVSALAVLPAAAQLSKFKPGFNLFSKQQDVQLGKEAAAEIEKQVEIVDSKELNAYINSIGQKLAAQPQADKYPYTFQVVNDPSINAFALPGGPTFINTGLIAAADNEAQIAGVMAHEIMHVALRHGTNQATRANLIQLPAMLGSAAVGSGSMLGQLAQLGIGLGANSVLLKYSRTAETQADLMGAQMAAQAGYNPIEIARFFEKLEAEGGARGPQFFSSHPNPGNRTKAIENEIRYMPKRQYNADTGQLPRMKALVAKLPPPKKKAGDGETAPAKLSIPDSRPSGRMQSYQGGGFSVSYPDNWKPLGSQGSPGVTIAPPTAIQQSQQGSAVGYGVVANVFKPKSPRANLPDATQELVSQMRSSDPGMRVGPETARQVRVGGKDAILTTLRSASIFQGQTELDQLITVSHPDGVFYLVLVAPESERQYADRAFDDMLQSLRFNF
ncbi:MAG: M48 family metalloprotease [Bryobacterales bacterium]|nr:M48 family metalloprotease [Bryobacterales bacterium]